MKRLLKPALLVVAAIVLLKLVAFQVFALARIASLADVALPIPSFVIWRNGDPLSPKVTYWLVTDVGDLKSRLKRVVEWQEVRESPWKRARFYEIGDREDLNDDVLLSRGRKGTSTWEMVFDPKTVLVEVIIFQDI